MSKSKRGQGFSMDGDMGSDRNGQLKVSFGERTGQRPEKKSKGTAKFMAWTFDQASGLVVPGIVLDEKEGKLGHSFKRTTQDGVKRVDETEFVDQSVWEKRSPQVESGTLRSIEHDNLILGVEGGALVMLKLVSEGNIRVWGGQKSGWTSDQFRTEFLAAELGNSDEVARQAAKDQLPRGDFMFPQTRGDGLVSRGVRRVFPVFETEDEARSNKYHNILVIIAAGRALEIMSMFNKRLGVSNFWEISVDDGGTPSVVNIRDVNSKWMVAAQAKVDQAKAQAKAEIQARRKSF